MNEVRMNRHDLSMKLEECRTMSLFLADAVYLILEENGNYNSDVCPVPSGAAACITMLSEKIKAIEQEI